MILSVSLEIVKERGYLEDQGVDNIKLHIREIGLEGVINIDSALDRDWCEQGREPWGSIKCKEYFD